VTTFDWGDRLPVLETGRLVLRHLTPADAADVFAVFSDPEVMRYWDGVPMTAVEQASAYIAEIDEHLRRRTLFQWGVVERTSGSVIGTCTLLHVSMPHQRAEIGFALGSRHWGKGLATELVDAMLTFAFDRLLLHRVEADVDPRNERSLRLLERLGFRREGYLRQRYYTARERQDTVMLGLLRHERPAAS